MDIGEAFFSSKRTKAFSGEPLDSPQETVLPHSLAEFMGIANRMNPGSAPRPLARASALRLYQDSFLAFRTCRPLYMPVFKSRWCGRRNSPESLSSA